MRDAGDDERRRLAGGDQRVERCGDFPRLARMRRRRIEEVLPVVEHEPFVTPAFVVAGRHV